MNSLTKIAFLALLVFDLYLFSTKSFFGKEYGLIFFSCFSLLIISFVLPRELSNIIGLKKIIIIKKIDYYRLIYLLPAGIQLLIAVISLDNNSWFGLNYNHFAAIMWLLLMFLSRSNYLLISKRFIKYQNKGMMDSIKIKWEDITKFDYKDDKVKLYSENEIIEINFNNISNTNIHTFKNYVAKLIGEKSKH